MDRAWDEATTAWEEGRFEDIQHLLKPILDDDPDEPTAHLWIGSALYIRDRPTDALPYLERATELNENSPAAWRWLGKCYQSLHFHKDAVEAARRMVELEPTDENRLELLEYQNDESKFVDFKSRLKAVESVSGDPTQAHVLRLQAFYNVPYVRLADRSAKALHAAASIDFSLSYMLASFYANRKQADEALAWLLNCMDLGLERGSCCLVASTAMVRIGAYSAALAWAKEAYDFAPGRHETILRLARVYCISGDFDVAHRIATEAVELFPRSPVAWMTLSHVLWRSGRRGEALRATKQLWKSMT